MEFNDVVMCRDVAGFNRFVRAYLAERDIVTPSPEASGYFWALFYKWKDSIFEFLLAPGRAGAERRRA